LRWRFVNGSTTCLSLDAVAEFLVDGNSKALMFLLLLVAFFFAVASFSAYAATQGFAPPPQIRPVQSVLTKWPYFREALGIRIVAAVLIRAGALSDFFAPDRVGYEGAGAALASVWWGQVAVSPEEAMRRFVHEPNFYHYANGVSYAVTAGPWLIILLNCVIGALLPGLVASITSRISDIKDAPRTAALLAAFFPSMIIWSSINIRDVWAIAAMLFAVDCALALRERLSLASIATFVGAMTVLGLLRSYMFVLVSVGFSLSVIASFSISRARGLVAAVGTAIICFYLYSSTGFGQKWVEDASLERLAQIREGMTVGAQSAYLIDADISSPMSAIRFLPFGFTYFWLGPFPWETRSLRQALVLPEMLAFYCLIPFLVTGLRETLSKHFASGATVVCVIGVVSTAYALVEGNYGTAYRHRAQVLPPVLALVAVGLAHRRSVKVSRSSTPGPS